MPIVKIQRLQPDARIPTYGSDGAACVDFYAYCPAVRTYLHANTPVTFNTGIAIEIPEGWALLIYSRSSHGFKSDTRLSNCVGVIDSDYYNNPNNEGEIFVQVLNYGVRPLKIKKGERIAQGIFIKYLKTDDDQPIKSQRLSGFGSTGKKGGKAHGGAAGKGPKGSKGHGGMSRAQNTAGRNRAAQGRQGANGGGRRN